MFNPKYRIELNSVCFLPPYEFICEGSQMILIIDALKEYLPEHTWYGADVVEMRSFTETVTSFEVNQR